MQRLDIAEETRRRRIIGLFVREIQGVSGQLIFESRGMMKWEADFVELQMLRPLRSPLTRRW
jgi:hypothetical protein